MEWGDQGWGLGHLVEEVELLQFPAEKIYIKIIIIFIIIYDEYNNNNINLLLKILMIVLV